MLHLISVLVLAIPLGCAASLEPAAEVAPAVEGGSAPGAELADGEAPLAVTPAEADALARDLAASLRRSSIPDEERQVLLERTPPRGFIDDEGRVRVGAWLLMRSGEEWVLFHRFLPPDPRKYLAHGATVTRTPAGFVVGDVHPVLLHPPRAQH